MSRACFPSECHLEMSHFVRLPARFASIEFFISEATVDADSGLIGTATWLSSTNAPVHRVSGIRFLRQMVTWVEEEDIHDDLLRLLGCCNRFQPSELFSRDRRIHGDGGVSPRRWMPRLIFLTRHFRAYILAGRSGGRSFPLARRR